MGNEEIVQQEKLTPHHLAKVKPCTHICYLETAKITFNIYIAWKYFSTLSWAGKSEALECVVLQYKVDDG